MWGLINEEGKRAVCRSKTPARGRKNPVQVLRPNTSAFRRENMHPRATHLQATCCLHIQTDTHTHTHTHTSVKQLGRVSQHCSLTCRNCRWRIKLWYSWAQFSNSLSMFKLWLFIWFKEISPKNETCVIIYRLWFSFFFKTQKKIFFCPYNCCL